MQTFSGLCLNPGSWRAKPQVLTLAETLPDQRHWVQSKHAESLADIAKFSTPAEKLRTIEIRLNPVEQMKKTLSSFHDMMKNSLFASRSEKKRVQIALAHTKAWEQDLKQQRDQLKVQSS